MRPSKSARIFTAAGIAAVLFTLIRRFAASPFDAAGSTMTYGDFSSSDPSPPIDYHDPVYAPLWQMEPIDAFLSMIRAAEHTAATIASGSEYSTFYGGRRFTDFSNHPVLTGEMRGVALSDSICRSAGFLPGCVSTAAGAYQITLPTWRDVQSWEGNLPDFSPASQDEAARRILRHDGAAAFIDAGDFPAALAIASQRWASLPGSTAAQTRRTFDFVLNAYNSALGIAA